jgi:hypothetical protein
MFRHFDRLSMHANEITKQSARRLAMRRRRRRLRRRPRQHRRRRRRQRPPRRPRRRRRRQRQQRHRRRHVCAHRRRRCRCRTPPTPSANRQSQLRCANSLSLAGFVLLLADVAGTTIDKQNTYVDLCWQLVESEMRTVSRIVDLGRANECKVILVYSCIL